ncbi:hypothetical protein LJE86_03910 [bacterium BMS3Abin03]|nr:hypothetical protein [bacterium BMS3Abin03]MCG6960659.1 hypothetical protein [bacterium BMS3Abin03]
MKRNLTLKSLLKNNWHGLLLSLLVIFNYFFPLTSEPHKAIDIKNTTAIIPTCIVKTVPEKIKEHNVSFVNIYFSK